MSYTIEQYENEKAAEAAELARVNALKDDVRIVGHGPSGWAVMSMSGAFRFDDVFDNQRGCIIYSGLSTREAAEVARWNALLGLTDQTHNSPYSPSALPLSYFDAVGRVLAKLREAGVDVDDLIALAAGIVDAAFSAYSPDPFEEGGDDHEIPF